MEGTDFLVKTSLPKTFLFFYLFTSSIKFFAGIFQKISWIFGKDIEFLFHNGHLFSKYIVDTCYYYLPIKLLFTGSTKQFSTDSFKFGWNFCHTDWLSSLNCQTYGFRRVSWVRRQEFALKQHPLRNKVQIAGSLNQLTLPSFAPNKKRT